MIPIHLPLIYFSKDFFIVGSFVFDGLQLLIGQFTVMDGSEADGDLVLIQTFLLYCVNQVILMLTSIFLGQFQ